MIPIRAALPGEHASIVAIDDDASRRYAEGGLVLGITDDHPFAIAERARWVKALEAGNVFFALAGGEPIGVAVLARVDGAPYLDQLSVRMEHMGRGVGRALLARAIEWAQREPLWLDTYDHLPWNRPFYERAGFVVVPEGQWGAQMRGILEEQRAALPDPHLRVVMRRG